jgi:hypothetical protein
LVLIDVELFKTLIFALKFLLMKKLLTLILILLLTSCNDGDFDIPAFEFSETVNICDEYLLYIASSNSTEVLILALTPTQLGSTAGEKNYDISTTISVTYRIFEEGIDNNYFCQAIPPSTPKVLKELVANSGNVNITTTEETATDGTVTGYSYTITFSDLLFDDGNERIFFESFEFGTFIIDN